MNSAFLVHASPGLLVLTAPPILWTLTFPVSFFLLGVFLFLRRLLWRPRPASGNAFSALRPYRPAAIRPGRFPALFGVILVVASTAIFAHLLQPTRLTLDRTQNTWTLNSSSLFFYPLRESGPLTTLKSVTTRSEGNKSEFMLLFRDGGSIPLNSWSDQPGQADAAAQVNAFLNP